MKSLQDDLNESEAKFTLAKQVFDFEQIVVVERSTFTKEREEHEKEVLELTKQISDL